MVVRVPYRVIYGDTDQMGVVYYANYLRLFEMSRNEYLRQTTLTYREIEERGFFLPVTEALVNYRKPARYDDLLTVEARILRARGARVRFSYIITDESGDTIVEGHTEHAAVDDTGRVVRLPREILEALDAEQT